MKIVLTTTFLVAVLAIGLFGMNNVFAQGDQEMVEENETGLVNSTGILNATLAFAQEGAITPEGINNNTMSMGNDTTGMKGMTDYNMKLNGTINVESTIAEAFKSKITTDIIGAIQAAQASVGANSFVKEAELTDAHGYLVYKILVVDENLKKYKVIVDPGNGQVLFKKDVTCYYDEHEKMKYGDNERYDKYSGSSGAHGYGDYNDQNKMIMKDKNY
jgi:hypothetical protein